MNNLRDFAMCMIRSNPSISGNPNAMAMINAISSGDSATGEQIATNLCNTYGIDKNTAVQQAKSFFGLP